MSIIEQMVTLAKAGFTAEQIMQMVQTPAPDAPGSTTTPAPAPAPATAPATAPAPTVTEPSNAELMEFMKGMQTQMHQQNIQNSQQPPVQTVDDILAKILDPHRPTETT